MLVCFLISDILVPIKNAYQIKSALARVLQQSRANKKCICVCVHTLISLKK